MTPEPHFITEAEAERRIEELFNEHPQVVEVVESTMAIAHPLAGPIRILNEILSVLGMEQVAVSREI